MKPVLSKISQSGKILLNHEILQIRIEYPHQKADQKDQIKRKPDFIHWIAQAEKSEKHYKV